MTVKQSYQNAYAKKNEAITKQYKSKKATLSAKKKRLEHQGEEKLRAAYIEMMRESAAAGQQNRAVGRFGGAAENQASGLKKQHAAERENISRATAEAVETVEQQLKNAAADKDKKISDNNAALQQKLDNLNIKEQKAAQKGSLGVSSKSASGKVSKSQAISLMKMGIYDASFADILGISDEQVRAFIKGLGKEKTKEEEKTDNRLPGTYKPPLR